jgi:regulation of enolase protein 1 (concanavalin A-like superfamily)
MRPLVLASVLLTAPLAAQTHRPPAVSVEQWSLPGAPPVAVEGGRAGLSRPEATAFSRAPVRGDFTLEATLAYRDLADGDVAGVALRGADGGWISLQLEQITPALLIAVRSHVPGGIEAHGRLLATTAVSGWHEGHIRLKIERRGRMVQFSHAPLDGAWQALGRPFVNPAGSDAEVGLFAVDGAERADNSARPLHYATPRPI